MVKSRSQVQPVQHCKVRHYLNLTGNPNIEVSRELLIVCQRNECFISALHSKSRMKTLRIEYKDFAAYAPFKYLSECTTDWPKDTK